MNFKIGTIVSLKSNGLLQLANYNFLSLGGNEHFTTPLMVIVEILINKTQEIDEESGEIKSTSINQNKYKCMYFSNRTMKFEENWFAEKELAVYGEHTMEYHGSPDSTKIKRDETVRFKTVDEEAKKSKSFNESENKKGTKPLVTFIAPAMQVVGFANPEKKDQVLDPNTGKPKRKYPSKMVRCKFFNTEADKFSEQLVPIECLQFIDNTRIEDWLKKIADINSNKGLFILKTIDNKYFGKPNSVNVYSGRFQLSFYNELSKKPEYVWIDQIRDFHNVDFSQSKYFPGLSDETGDLISILEFIQDNNVKLEGQHFKIIYCNLKEQRVSRYVTIKKIGVELKNDSFFPVQSYYYLKSYCHLREAGRDFRSDRILSIRTINDIELNELLSKKVSSRIIEGPLEE